MCDTIRHPDPVRQLVHEWEHGALSRREFFERALGLLGTITAANALLAACSPAVVTPTTTSAPAAAATATAAPVATAAGTRAAPTAAATAPSQSSVPGFVDPGAVDTTDVTYPSGNVKMLAYMAKPKSGTSWPAVIVIHENRGLVDHIKDVTRRVANLGYVALGVDLLSRSGGTAKFAPPADPTQAINALKQEDVNADLVASAAYLKTLSFVKTKVGIVGFCRGAGNSLMGAINSNDIVACVSFYGPVPQNLDDVQKLNGPVQGNYGEQDTFVTPGVARLADAMKKYNKSFDPKVYPGANHAFFNDTGPRYNEAAAKDAWARLVAFYKTNLAA